MSDEPDKDFIDEEVERHDPYDPLDVSRANAEADVIDKEAKKAVGEFLERRMQAYRRVFNGGATAEDLELVRDDLTTFCMGEDTVFHQDQRVHCLLTGRQEVFRRIKDHTDLSFDALVAKYTRPV